MSEHIERIEAFTQTLKEQQACYILINEQGLLITPSTFDDTKDALLVWSSNELSSDQIKSEWQAFEVLKLDFDDFTDLLSHLSEDNLLVGIELTDEQIAIELDAAELLTQLTS
jgi:hypothetical protein